MATIRVKNVSGKDREVPLPNGKRVTVPSGHSEEFETEHAKSLLEQTDNWTKYVPAKSAGDTQDKE